jgi:peptidoglycan/xylan/chitin deacetylase (PgdA/CDA1 family)
LERRVKLSYSFTFIFLSISLSILLIHIIISINDDTIGYNHITYSYPDISSLEEEYNFYLNIDDALAKEKEEYFSNIRKLEEKIQNGESDKKIAYLTFDDGPYKLTYTVLDILKENNVRATFFVRGNTNAIDRYKRMVEEGHTIGNHTYYHNIFTGLYSSSSEFISQVDKLADLIYENTGYKQNVVRFPGGSPSAGSKKSEIVNKLHEKGYGYIDWTCHVGDGSDKLLKQDSEWNWYKKTCSGQNIMVILMHDYNYGTAEILDNMIKDLKNQGYLILPLSNKSIMAN